MAMDAAELKARQRPRKEEYRDDPEAARVTARAVGRLGEDVSCRVDGWGREIEAGLHPAAGGDGSRACSADLLLEALVACAGVTLNALATHMEVPLEGATIRAEGTWDARGTLGVSKDAPVGLTEIELTFELETDADAETRRRLVELTERYCVILQTLRDPPEVRFRLPADGGGTD